jgi:hypothetical protein
MRCLALILVALAVPPPQDPPKVTLTRKGKFSEVAKEVVNAVGAKVEIDSDVEDKEVSVDLHNAGYFQALDALCRSHKMTTYLNPWVGRAFSESADLRLSVAPWAEYPHAYPGDFKIILLSLERVSSLSINGERSWTRARVALLAPPSVKVDDSSGAGVAWTISEAQDADGKNVLPTDPEPKEQLMFGGAQIKDFNAAELTVRLSDFDVYRGMAMLRGRVLVTVAERKELQIDCVPGKRVAVPGGTIVVEAVSEHAKDHWRIQLTFEPTDPGIRLDRALEHRASYSESNASFLTFPKEGKTFVVDTGAHQEKPAWVKLRFRVNPKDISIPFELKPVRFKKE